jgi:Beta-ketoacyl synthase, N-terminal domain
MRAFVEGIGVLGPGLAGWEASRAVLAGGAPYRPAPAAVPASELLPPAERRRTGLPVKLALAVGREAFVAAGRDAAVTATVFTASCGDGQNLHDMCESLAAETREVSPTRFHNSVHNAAAGYWGIATRSREASTSLCAYDASFSAGLLEALAQVAVDGTPVALIAYDQPYPEPLHRARPIGGVFAAALVLAPVKTPHAVAAIEVSLVTEADGAPTAMADPELERARATIPAGRGLPLLAALAAVADAGAEATVILEYLEGARLRVTVRPCS